MKNKFLRLLTFLCFFQFSGINNGYTILTSVSPLSADQSATCLTRTLQDIHATLQPRTVLPLIQAGHGWVVSATLKSENAIRNFFRDAQGPHQSMRIQTASGASSAYRTKFEVRGTFSLGMKETWSKREESSDEDADGLTGEPQTAQNGSETMVQSAGSRGFEGHDLDWKRRLTRRFGSSLTGDDAAKIYITRSRI